jgi:hypothetical protein
VVEVLGKAEEVRSMRLDGQRNVRVQNADGNWLDQFGSVPTDRAGSHDTFVCLR